MPDLDFLRGFAAFYVVLFHFSSRVAMGGLMEHGYLAVDFFFCLSGVVIHRAYYESVATRRLDFGAFARLRLERLLPMVLLGNAMAAVIDLYRPGPFSHLVHLRDIAVTFVLQSLLLPTPFRTTLEDGLYPLNGPVWSLFFELVANVVFCALAARSHSRRWFGMLAFANVATMIVAINVMGSAHFGPHLDNMLLGFPRVFASFFLGVMIGVWRLPPLRINRWIAAGVLLLVLMPPHFGHVVAESVYDIVALFVVFPVVIHGATRSGPSDRLAVASGEFSYPLYCLHYPWVRAIGAVLRGRSLPLAGNFALSIAAAGALAVVAWGVFHAIDVPVRRSARAWRHRRAVARLAVRPAAVVARPLPERYLASTNSE